MTIVLQQDSVLKALSGGAETDSFLGNVVELAIVTSDHKRTMDGLLKLGIGPWRVYKFSPENTENQTYRVKRFHSSSPSALRSLAIWSGN
ncbi:hypothetical protein [Rhizobium leguminosarum]|uniref:hypothetical protein n=1 Tax=Rhizobium leguminosarum TaxID=384 RepID=UPI0021B10E93|nr:hypothetical protein [Rhizobium leguminosarum]